MCIVKKCLLPRCAFYEMVSSGNSDRGNQDDKILDICHIEATDKKESIKRKTNE